MNVILEVFLNTFWQAAALAFVVWAGLRWLPRVNAATRGAIWWSVLAFVLLLPALRVIRAPHTPVMPRASARAQAVPTVGRFPMDEALPAAPAPRIANSSAPFRVRAGDWPAFFLAIWCAICLAQLARLALSFRHLRRLKRDARPAAAAQRENLQAWLPVYGIRRPVRLLVSRSIPVPVAVGFLRPAVLLPESLLAELTPVELDHVLLHELAHLARRDDWTNLFTRLAWAMMALHPVAAFALRQIDHERELACDDWVVSATGAARPYAASLARLFELCSARRGILLASGIADGGSQLGNRIALLLRRGREFTPQASALRVALCSAALLLFVIGASRAPAWVAFAQNSPSAPSASASAPAPRYGPRPAAEPARDSNPTAPPVGNSLLAALVANGYGDLSVDEIVDLKNQGMTADYIAGIARSGIGKLRPSMLIELRQQGVKPEYVHDLLAVGIGPLAVRTIVEFKNQGVSVELLAALKEYGLLHAEPGEIIQARQNGVGPASLREAKKYSSNLTIKQIIRLKQAGVI